ncbi:cytidine deaminase-like protein [Leucosporidium creatinivorum]|uniref:Cytidine deaminase n=1 Tax=Leucosporidium creatinivorum TaxID=106004 RepID=A0A1Y2FZW9_9BASI|nr:cytidine deaminase-like protein [Leucosporidium creatinivorum]
MSVPTLSDAKRAQLIISALKARDGSYSPYSNFRVGAALLAEDETIVLGANVECASYGGTICAERTAIVKGVSDGHKRFNGLAVSSDVDGPISPCGICRQVLREFCPLDMPILLVPSNYSSSTQTVSATEALQKEGEDILVLTSMGEMLPLSFGPSNLDKPNP